MTNEQIFELAETCGFGVNKYKICICWKDELLKFALLIHKDGYNKGYDEGYDSSTTSSKMNMWEEE